MLEGWLKLLPVSIRTRIASRTNLSQILVNTGWLFADKLIRLCAGLLVTIWIARYLGPVQFGIYNYAIAFVALFTPIASLGLDNIVISEIVKNPLNKHRILGTAFALKFLGGLITLLLSTSFVLFLNPGNELKFILVLVVAICVLFQPFDVIDFWFQSQVSSKFSVYARNGAFLLATLLRIALIILGKSLIAFSLAVLIETLFSAIGLFLVYSLKSNRVGQWKVSLEQAKYLLSKSGFLILSSLAIMIYMRIDLVMLESLANTQEVGIYSAVVRISEVWFFVPVTIVGSVFPAIIQLKKLDETLYYIRLAELFKWLAIFAYVITLPLALFSNNLISLLYGFEYNRAGPVLALHVWCGLFVALGVAQNAWEVAEELTHLTLQKTIIGAVCNVILNLWLIVPFGALGAAIATVVSYGLSAFLLNLVYKKTRKSFFMQLNSLIPFWHLGHFRSSQ